MAVLTKKDPSALVKLRKGNEQRKVHPDLVADYLKQGWKKIKVVKGKRDENDVLLPGEEDKVVLEGIEEFDKAAYIAEIADLKKQITALKKQNKALKETPAK